MPYYVLLLLLFAVYSISSSTYSLYKNLRLAQSSGIPYVIAPVYHYNRLWLLTAPIWLPLLNRLPKFLTHPWIDLVEGDWIWRSLYTPFSPTGAPGAETFIIVSPGKNILCTAEAEVINQVTTRRNDFPKPIAIYKSLDVYGKNVVSVEGAEWRRHRKVTAPQFNEKSNAVVWKESLFQAGEMVKSWGSGQEEDAKKHETANGHANGKSNGKGSLIGELSKDTMRLSLHVISRAGFGVRCLWPGAKDTDISEGSMDSNVIPKGHEMSYTTSLETLLHRIIAVLILPGWFMSEYGVPMDFEMKLTSAQNTFLAKVYTTPVQPISNGGNICMKSTNAILMSYHHPKQKKRMVSI
jgi:hypothetical protein